MLKKNNKGFTLLELLIAITTVIFIGYKVIDKVTIDSKNQGNINRGRLTMNNINEYLTKDLEQTTSIEFRIYVDWEADTKLEEENSKIEILNRLLGNKSFTYEYKLRFNDDNKYSIYKVNIDK